MATAQGSRLYATAALGAEDLVAAELRRLGCTGVTRAGGGVEFDAGPAGPLATGMRACLHLRIAARVLLPLATFPATDADTLYDGVRAVAWEEWMVPERTFAVHATTGAEPPLAHSPFLAQRTKDAVVDRLRERQGARPDVAKDAPDVLLYLHVAQARGKTPSVTVGLDVGGGSLHRRGYRVTEGAAPLRETLAAAVVAATGWPANPSRPFVDPMCGSGTLAIEAAMVALELAPGLIGRETRGRRFGFERWPGFGDAERTNWTRLLDEARGAVRATAPGPIIASDRDPDAVAQARLCAAAAGAGVAGVIDFRVADVRAFAAMTPPASIVTNPPYGERMGGSATALEGFWRGLSWHLRTLDGHTAFILCGSPEMTAAVGIRPAWERRFMNGPLPVILARFELGRQAPPRARGARGARGSGEQR